MDTPEFTPGTTVIANVSKQRRAHGTVVSAQGDVVRVKLQQTYKGADGKTHVSTWQQRMPACKLSKA